MTRLGRDPPSCHKCRLGVASRQQAHLPTCHKCNWRVVDYVDRLGLGKVPGMAARRRAVKAHTEACAKMAGV